MTDSYRPTSPRRNRRPVTSDFSALLNQVRDAGLLRRRRGFYLSLTAFLLIALVAIIVGMVLVGDSWWQLALAVALGLVFAQFGFLAHEAAHREVFEGGAANDRFGRFIADLVVGISLSQWKAGHNRHHANPNRMGKDPSVDPGIFAFRAEDAQRARGAYAWWLRHQGALYFPVLMLAGVNLYIESFRAVFGRAPVEHRGQELALLLTRTGAFLALVFSTMSALRGALFIAVQLVVFGVATASAFVVNHVGMPVLEAHDELDYLRRQLLTSRNIRGGWFTTAWMGGLNFQIEHHLFPSMPRPNLRAASSLVRAYCEERDLVYTQVDVAPAFGAVTHHMKTVGLAAGLNLTACPTAAGFGR